jgi:phosphoglycerate dehydrogenase-like enzyme
MSFNLWKLLMNNVSILCIWDVPERLQEYLRDGTRHLNGLKLIFPEEAVEEEYLKHAPDVDVIIGWRPTPNLLEQAKKLRLFINPGTGIQHHLQPFRELTKTRDVTLVNGHGNSYFTAQHAVALLLTVLNKVIPHHNWMVEGQWRRGDKDAISTPLRNRHLGLLGYGAINQKVHRLLSGFNVSFSALKRSWREFDTESPTELGKYTTEELDDFLDQIDIMIIAIPHTEETEGLIGHKELSRLGPEGIVVNVARGPILDENGLYQVLSEQIIAGAAIDVWYEYRPEPDEDGHKYPYTKPFYSLDNIVLSPHRGASPFNDLKRWDEVVENIKRFASGRRDFLNVVDLERGY